MNTWDRAATGKKPFTSTARFSRSRLHSWPHSGQTSWLPSSYVYAELHFGRFAIHSFIFPFARLLCSQPRQLAQALPGLRQPDNEKDPRGHFRPQQANGVHDVLMRHRAHRYMQHEARDTYLFAQVNDLLGDCLRIACVQRPFEAARSIEGGPIVMAPAALRGWQIARCRRCRPTPAKDPAPDADWDTSNMVSFMDSLSPAYWLAFVCLWFKCHPKHIPQHIEAKHRQEDEQTRKER